MSVHPTNIVSLPLPLSSPPPPLPSPPPPSTHLFWHSPDVGEAFPEHNEDLACPTAQCRSGTVKGSVPGTEHNHIAMEGGKSGLTRTHTFKEGEGEGGREGRGGEGEGGEGRRGGGRGDER